MRAVRPIAKVKSVMTLFPHRVDAGFPIADAVQFMQDHGIRHLPVVGTGNLLGVVTDDDLRVAAAAAGDRSDTVTVGSVCRTEPYVVDVDEPLDVVAESMADRQRRCALVTREGELIGILTTTDICRILARKLRDHIPPEDEIA